VPQKSAKDLPRPSTGTPNWISTGSQWELVFNRISMRSGQDPNGILTGSQLDLNKISMGSGQDLNVIFTGPCWFEQDPNRILTGSQWDPCDLNRIATGF
jgi:hypothetical protein